MKKIQSLFNIQKHLPKKYISKFIFRTFFCLILLVGLYDYYLNGFSLQSFSIECPYNQNNVDCDNPLYICNSTEYTNCNYRLKHDHPVCLETGLCDKKYIPQGYQYGRQDIIHEHGDIIIFSLIILSIILNHIFYVFVVKHEVNR